MTTLSVGVTTDYSAAALSSVDLIVFTNTVNPASAAFANFQFNNAAIINTLAIIGTAVSNSIFVNGGSVDASQWQFGTWDAATDFVRFNGTTSSDVIIGSSQNDIFNSSSGIDTLVGGAGNDVFQFSKMSNLNYGDSIDGGSGTQDLIEVTRDMLNVSWYNVSITNVEILKINDSPFSFVVMRGSQIGGTSGITTVIGSATLDDIIVNDSQIDLSNVTFANWATTDLLYIVGLNSDDTLIGSSLNDDISGNDGADLLDGRTGVDLTRGGAGNDTYIVDNVLDTVTELAADGFDIIYASATYTMSANTERLYLTGAENINGTGLNGQVDVLTGNNGNNILNGLSGNDIMRGGRGNDTYIVESTSDVVQEGSAAGTDSIKSTTTFIMTANTERLYLIGSAAINGTGVNGSGDLIVGNNNANRLNGLSGNDTLTGALGLDVFLFNTALNAATNHDTITDFKVADDTIQLENAIFTLLPVAGPMALAFFKDLSLGAQDANDVIIYNRATGDLFYDNNGLTAGGQTLFADVTNNTALTFADFVVV